MDPNRTDYTVSGRRHEDNSDHAELPPLKERKEEEDIDREWLEQDRADEKEARLQKVAMPSQPFVRSVWHPRRAPMSCRRRLRTLRFRECRKSG